MSPQRRRAPSLSRRLLVSVSLPLVLFFGLTILVLDASFREVSERALRDLLDGQMVALIAAAEPRSDGAIAPLARGLETRLTTPGSGLYAEIRTRGQEALWRSPSTAGAFLDFGELQRPGGRSFSYATTSDGKRIAIANRGISFEEEEGRAFELTFSVATSMAPYEEQLWSFRSQLFGWFLGLTLLLLATLGILLRWVLAPVRRLEREITHVEDGRRDTLGESYPRELSGVAANLNALLIGERKRVSRYRDTLGNLAHSLKTPLAVMRSSLGMSDDRRDPAALNAEIDRMSGIIEHQLKRAAASGGALLGQAPVEIAPIATELRGALLKVYAHKDFSFELVVPPHVHFVGDRGDLIEMLGNVLDNACKWCRGRVRFAVRLDTHARARVRLALLVEDDGPGIADADRARVLERGVRVDEKTPGHGIGLTMVRDTVELYGGTLTLARSDLGGLCVDLRLPGR